MSRFFGYAATFARTSITSPSPEGRSILPPNAACLSIRRWYTPSSSRRSPSSPRTALFPTPVTRRLRALRGAPAHPPPLAAVELLDGEHVVPAAPLQDPLVPLPRGGVDRDDDEPVPERPAEHLDLLPPADAVDDRR